MKNCETARHLRYHDTPLHFRWDYAESQWVERQQIGAEEKTIGRMYTVSPSDSERFYLRLLLLNVSGPQSFEDLRTVDNVLYPTFHDAAEKRQLLLDDQEYDNCLNEAIFYKLSQQLRDLFSVILVFGTPANALSLWTKYVSYFCEDYPRL